MRLSDTKQTSTAGVGARQDFGALPDAVLVREAKAGNSAAYTTLVARYQDRVFTIVYGQIRNREDALDLAQDVFVKAHQHLGRFREDSVFYTWLYRIAVNTCIDYTRRRKRTPDPFSLDQEPNQDLGPQAIETRYHHRPHLALENEELGKRIQVALTGLPDLLRMAVILHDIEGLSQKEIAAIMGCPLGTAKSRIQRARCELRVQLLPFLTGSEA